MINDRPPMKDIAKTLLNSKGVEVKTEKNGIKFVFHDNYVIDELKQLGFALDILKVQGGEMPLPVLAIHIDEQASLEAYWSGLAEKARYEFSVVNDNFDYWYQGKYALISDSIFKEEGKKPTQKEIECKIVKKYRKILDKKRSIVRKAEHNYRILSNVCFASVVTKGKMLQSLRNILQPKDFSIGINENKEIDLKKLKASI
jgi:hypothetical protein